MVCKKWGGESFFSDSDMFSWVKLDPKFGQNLGFGHFQHFLYFFLSAKKSYFIGNAFNGYSYLKSTRKGLSDGTLMLKKEYHLARWLRLKSYTFPKKISPRP